MKVSAYIADVPGLGQLICVEEFKTEGLAVIRFERESHGADHVGLWRTGGDEACVFSLEVDGICAAHHDRFIAALIEQCPEFGVETFQERSGT